MSPLRRPGASTLVEEPALGPTSGTVSGWFGIVLGLVVLVVALTDRSFGDTPVLVSASLLGIALVWTLLLRPRIVLRRDAMVLRNGFVDHVVPWGLVDGVTVRSVTHVHVGERRYVGTAVGRSTLRMVRDERQARAGSETVAPGAVAVGANLPDFLEARVAERLRDASRGEGRVRRLIAWPEVVLVALPAVALVIALAR